MASGLLFGKERVGEAEFLGKTLGVYENLF